MTPDFIWPNVNPFRRAGSVVDAVPKSGTAGKLTKRASSLRTAREWVRRARDQRVGLPDERGATAPSLRVAVPSSPHTT